MKHDGIAWRCLAGPYRVIEDAAMLAEVEKDFKRVKKRYLVKEDGNGGLNVWVPKKDWVGGVEADGVDSARGGKL